MKSSPMILALLSAATLVRAGESTPSPTPSPTPLPASPLSPPDGAVYQVGEPILVEGAEQSGCPYGSTRYLDRIAPPSVTKSTDDFDEVIRINEPGSYLIERICRTGEFSASLTRTYFVVTSPCSSSFPPPPNSGDDNPQDPVVSISTFTTVTGSQSVLTGDNSFSKIDAIQIENKGEGDLVLLDITPLYEFDSFKITVENFERYSVVRPGHKYYVALSGEVLAPEVMLASKREEYNLSVRTSDPQNPILVYQVAFTTFATAADVPSFYRFSDPPPPNPATPECADQNSDGTVDASDVVNFILQR